MLGEPKYRAQFFIKTKEISGSPYRLRSILQFVMQCGHMSSRSLCHCGIRGPAGKSAPRAPRCRKTALHWE